MGTLCNLAPLTTSFGTVCQWERQHLAMVATTSPEVVGWAHPVSSGTTGRTSCGTPERLRLSTHLQHNDTAHSAARSTSNFPQLRRLLPVDHPRGSVARVVTVWRHVADVLAVGLMDTRCFLIHLHSLVVRW